MKNVLNVDIKEVRHVPLLKNVMLVFQCLYSNYIYLLFLIPERTAVGSAVRRHVHPQLLLQLAGGLLGEQEDHQTSHLPQNIQHYR